MEVKPTFPVVVCRVPSIWIRANSEDGLHREAYEDLAVLGDDLEWIDTRKHPDIWIEDANGVTWDVKLNIHLVGLEGAEFFLRKGS